jgi:hypothetical protein
MRVFTFMGADRWEEKEKTKQCTVDVVKFLERVLLDWVAAARHSLAAFSSLLGSRDWGALFCFLVPIFLHLGEFVS